MASTSQLTTLAPPPIQSSSRGIEENTPNASNAAPLETVSSSSQASPTLALSNLGERVGRPTYQLSDYIRNTLYRSQRLSPGVVHETLPRSGTEDALEPLAIFPEHVDNCAQEEGDSDDFSMETFNQLW